MPPRDPRRPDRVGAAVREEVAAFINRDLKDPRVTGLVTVTAVEMTRDLRHATVFVSVMGSDADRTSTLEGLTASAAHLRGRVGRALRLQFAPEITFRLDESVARAARIESLLADIKRAEAPAQADLSPAADAEASAATSDPDAGDTEGAAQQSATDDDVPARDE
jgi:ribosome-binding factor A